MSSTLTITTKGQVTFKKDVLKHLGVAPGDKIEIEKLPGGAVRATSVKRKGKISAAFGMLQAPPGLQVTIEQMSGDHAAEQGAWPCD